MRTDVRPRAPARGRYHWRRLKPGNLIHCFVRKQGGYVSLCGRMKAGVILAGAKPDDPHPTEICDSCFVLCGER